VGISFEHPWALLVLLLPVAWWGWERWRGQPGSTSAAAPARPGAQPRAATQSRLLQLLRSARPGPFAWMRLIVTLLLVLALAGTGITYSAKHQAVMFVADISTSTATSRIQMEDFIRKAIGDMPAGDVAGVLAAGEDAELETPVAARPTFSGFTTVVRPDHTDLERGLRLGAALLPSGYRPRLVLLSDGKENVGNAMAEVQRLQQRGFTVDVVNLAPTPGAEALIKSMEAPGALRLGERLDVNVTLSATAATKATLRIYEEQTLLETRPLSLQTGDQQVRLTMEDLKAGYHRIWATLEAERDTLTQNNTAAVMVGIQGAPSVLVVEGFPGSGQNIRRALEATGMSVDVRTPDGLPTHGTQLSRYASVVMVDVPVPLLRADSLDAIATYVKQGGHGLVVIGGEHSYAMGGYAGTKLEELLPVTMDVPQRTEKPPVAVALIIENFESDQKVNVSKEAGKALVDMLTPRDYILVGDANVVGSWPVPPQRVTDKAKIKSLIDAMSPGDPPHYIDHLEAAAAELRRIDAKLKHIVLAGDGDAESASFADYASRIGRIAADGITILPRDGSRCHAADLPQGGADDGPAGHCRGGFPARRVEPEPGASGCWRPAGPEGLRGDDAETDRRGRAPVGAGRPGAGDLAGGPRQGGCLHLRLGRPVVRRHGALGRLQSILVECRLLDDAIGG
jgi:Ca-activated chloride channel family protein